jgi:hypothetical protein
MNADGHLKKAQEIYENILILREHGDETRAASSIVELAYGCAFHYLAYGCEQKFERHIDTHAGLSKLLVTTALTPWLRRFESWMPSDRAGGTAEREMGRLSHRF